MNYTILEYGGSENYPDSFDEDFISFPVTEQTTRSFHTFDEYVFSDVSRVPFTIWLVLGILICIGNVIVLVVLPKATTLYEVTRALLANLAGSDIIFGACAVVGSIAMFVKCAPSRLFHVMVTLVTTSLLCSFGTVCLTSANAFFFLKVPHFDKQKNLTFIKSCQSAIWVCSIGMGTLSYFVTSSDKLLTVSAVDLHPYFHASIGCLLMLTIVASTILQALTGYGLKRRERESRAFRENLLGGEPRFNDMVSFRHQGFIEMEMEAILEEDEVCNPSRRTSCLDHEEWGEYEMHLMAHPGQIRQIDSNSGLGRTRCSVRSSRRGVGTLWQQRHACIIITIISVCMVVCWTPSLLVLVLHLTGKVADIVAVFPYLFILGLLNALMNLMIYFVKDKKFRERCIKLLMLTRKSQFVSWV